MSESRVLFVCTANVCRNPMAEAVFNALAEDGRLRFRADSASTAALESRAMAPNAVAALEKMGIHPGPHSARRVDEARLEEFGLVLTMTPQHTATVRRLTAGEKAREIHTLPEYVMGLLGKVSPTPTD